MSVLAALLATAARAQVPCAPDSGARAISPPLLLFASVPVDSAGTVDLLAAGDMALGAYVDRFTRPSDITIVQAKAEALMRRAGGDFAPRPAPLAEVRFTVHSDGRYAGASRVIPTGDPRFDAALLEPVERMRREGLRIIPAGGPDSMVVDIAVGLDPGAGRRAVPLATLAPLTTITRPAHLVPTNIYPVWPKSMEDQRINDDVVVRILVSARGRAVMDSVKVVRGKHKEYIDAVLAVLPRYRWTPALAGACTVPQWVEMPFMFHFADAK